jgi:ankyrin repeat protein
VTRWNGGYAACTLLGVNFIFGFYNYMLISLCLGHDEIAQLLLSRGASVDASSSYGAPLVAAGVRGKFSVMKILLENNADVISK